MPFEPEEIERVAPSVRVEAQDYYARKFLADRKRRLYEVCKPIPWPHRTGVWHVNDWERRETRRLTREMEPKDAIRNGR